MYSIHISSPLHRPLAAKLLLLFSENVFFRNDRDVKPDFPLTKRSFKGFSLNFLTAGLCRTPRLVPQGMLPTGSPRFRN